MSYVIRLFAVVPFIATLGATTVFAQDAGVLTMSDVIELAKMTGFTTAAKVSYVSKRCVDFKLDASATKRLQAGGVKGELLTAVRAACYTAPEDSTPTSQASPEEVAPSATNKDSGKPKSNSKKPSSSSPSQFEQEMIKKAMEDPSAMKALENVGKVSGLASEFARRMAEADAQTAEWMQSVAAARVPAEAARAARLKGKRVDIIGFEKPLPPDPDRVVFESIGGVVDSVAVFMLSEKTSRREGMLGTAGAGVMIEQMADCKRWKKSGCVRKSGGDPGITHRGFAHPALPGAVGFFFHVTRNSTDKVKVEGITCTYYAADGSVLARNSGFLDFGKSQTAWFETYLGSPNRKTPFAPGAYGVECAKDDVPFINSTYDLK